MTQLLIVGPPGAGKGTQAARLSAVYGIPAISTGEIFRREVHNKTAIGLEVATILEAGDYVPDKITSSLVETRLRRPDAASGFVLDGYPRTVPQVSELDVVLAKSGRSLDAVVYLDVDLRELVGRLVKRGFDTGRSDDDAVTIHHRLDIYRKQTAPVLEIYRSRGLLIPVDGLGSVDAVQRAVVLGLAAR